MARTCLWLERKLRPTLHQPCSSDTAHGTITVISCAWPVVVFDSCDHIQSQILNFSCASDLFIPPLLLSLPDLRLSMTAIVLRIFCPARTSLHHRHLVLQSQLALSGSRSLLITPSLSVRSHATFITRSRSESYLSRRENTSSVSHFFSARSQFPTSTPQRTFPHRANTKFEPIQIVRLQSGTTSWVSALLLCVASSAVLYAFCTAENKVEQRETHIQYSKEQEDLSIMTAEAQPGRPGTLTLEQEEKLREFWIAVLQVFGVLEKEANGESHTDSAAASVEDSSKKPKKRLGLFRKKDHDKKDSASTDSGTHTPAADADDKYGQTKEFQDALANQSPESLRATFWSMVKHDHPDALLLRFLRARKWDVEKALVMMVSTMRWRATEMHVDDDIIKNGEAGSLEDSQSSDPAKKKLGEDFLTQMRMGKSFLHGLDKDNRPMCFVRARLHRQGEQSEESLERYTVFVIETARMILAPPVDTACIVFDLTGFSMANMDYAPVKFMIKCFEANYPESLGVVLVHKAPWIFQGVWKIIRGWLDPVVASKVHFTNNNKEMEAFVSESRIITELEGSEDWTYKYIEPVPGENDKMKDTETRDKLLKHRETIVDEYEKSTLEWIHGEWDLVAIKKKRNEVASKLRDNYWGLDPYIRARSYYDRVGLINPGGKIEFYKPAPVSPAAAVPADQPPKVETSPNDLD